ncbi:AraC family transcriptional regulator [Porticoccaceae bacterium]|jgi:AraC-like DNA-binding protein|nr:AraC family transcriptional regulator [Porticoccaceae bacterium]MDA8903563.1 AraC family transcriptional regulator [Porticoccaceae bacterium]MDA8920072.1 AraC family transcriptional regulator [Porticoccaceae bacterium]MDA8936740.1 AraC family transcriptional regulator [Porticoccaceae bacterium]MDB2319446.1 AraC family transcriptional regulator [Porticoccaceae bacterium]
MTGLTDSGTLARLAYQGLINLGVDADLVMQRSGLNPDQLYQANLRTKFSAQPLFWKAAAELSNDPCIGLHLGEKMPVYKGQILEYLFLSSPTFGDGLRRVLSYQRLISDALHGQLSEQPSPCLTSYFTDHQYATSHLAEAMVLGLIRCFQSVTDNAFKADKVVFNHAPNTDIGEYERIFQCQVEFNAPSFQLFFPASLLNHRSLHAQPELLNLHLQAADQHIAMLQQQDLIGNVRNQLAGLLESGDTSLENVATRLDISARHLRHQLNVAGTSFQRLLNSYRHSLAKRLLSQTDEAISEIVYLTGFSEPSTFYRAFKRWEGLTPIEYRISQQVQPSHENPVSEQ